MECCAEGLNDVGLLANVYRYYILSCNDRSDTHYVSKLRNLLRIYGGLSAEEWHDVADGLARDCARNIIDRIKYQPEMTTKGGTQRHSSWRNPAYEKLIVDERLSDAALTYCVTVDYPPLPLLRTIAIEHPESAKSIILDAMPYGTMGMPVFRFTVERGVDNTLTARRATYQQFAEHCVVSPQCSAMRRPVCWHTRLSSVIRIVLRCGRSWRLRCSDDIGNAVRHSAHIH